jgi:SAM-dependent methyltransferase
MSGCRRLTGSGLKATLEIREHREENDGKTMNEAFDPNTVSAYELETWKRCADSYVDTFAGITQETVSLLVDAANIQAGSKVLDIGSGPGHVAAQIAECGADVTGVDFSAEMVKEAQTRYPDLTFEQADAEKLPFAADSFDAVVANYVVHHLARPDVVFAEVCRVLKPGSHFAFAVWGPPEEQSSIVAFFGAVESHHDLAELPQGPLFGITDRAVYEPMLAKAGLELRQLAVHETVWRTDSLEPVLRGFWDYGDMKSLPSGTQARIKETTRENAQTYERKGSFVFPHSALVGSAMRL